MDKQPPVWVRNYIGIPFADYGREGSELDCWGLYRKVLSEQAGIDIPEFGSLGYNVGNRSQNTGVSEFMTNKIRKGMWLSVSPDHERLFDGILLRILGLPIHVGVIVARGFMLHTEYGVNSCLERYDRTLWSKRIIGIYRYNGAQLHA